MSPFKGQGANQALVDGLLLARAISKVLNARAAPSKAPFSPPSSTEPTLGLTAALASFEVEMLQRGVKKMRESAEAAAFLHSEAAAAAVGNVTRANAARAWTEAKETQ
mmetsp:Transcript_43127/g.87205  ORF Transcript_43127/g.87205 Transcript_43127/m.87205 type:complete len:108 (+) Transcript_43127:578-901(+)